MEQTYKPTVEMLREDALQHYDKLATENHHWNSFVVKAIESYTPLDDEESYYLKRKEILDKFTPEFAQKYWHTSPVFKRVMEELMRNKSPYDIIQILIDGQKELQDKFTEYIMKEPPQPIHVFLPPKKPTRWERFLKWLNK
jgi:hypothetical protein